MISRAAWGVWQYRTTCAVACAVARSAGAASQVARGRYRILRYQLVDLAAGKLKDEVRGKAVGIPFHLLAEADGLELKKHSQIAIEQDLSPAECENPLRNLVGSRNFDESRRLVSSGHGDWSFKNRSLTVGGRS